MRFLDRRVRSMPWCSLALLLLLFTGATNGCQNNHIGRPCDLNVPDEMGSAASTITGDVLSCPTRICMIPAALTPTDTKPYCSAECETNDDCSEGEVRSKPERAGGDKRCQGGFVCGVASIIGEFCCKKLCICRDFLLGGVLDPNPPLTCTQGAASTCRNVR
jgi:hypothetical protein